MGGLVWCVGNMSVGRVGLHRVRLLFSFLPLLLVREVRWVRGHREEDAAGRSVEQEVPAPVCGQGGLAGRCLHAE